MAKLANKRSERDGERKEDRSRETKKERDGGQDETGEKEI